MKLTIKVKLLPTEQEKQSLLKTMQVFNEACNFISKKAFKNKTYGQVNLHHLCYYKIREKYGLSAQMTIRAIGKVSESYKIDKKKLHFFKEYSAVVYDHRILSFKNLDMVSILTLNGRFKIPIVFGSYAKLEQRRVRGQADLIYQRGNLYLCLVVELPDGTPITPTGVLGVDMGIINLATTSDGTNFSGKTSDKIRRKATNLKAKLQKCGSKSAKRHLKKFAGKERRFKRNINHIISKKIVQAAKDTKRAIAIEDLKGFRTTVRKKQREQFGKWSFFELRKFIEYKAQLAGVMVVTVNPRNTSKTCSRCGYVSRSNRQSQSKFVCKQCGFSLNADLNASKNIALLGSVNSRIAVHFPVLKAPSLGTASHAL